MFQNNLLPCDFITEEVAVDGDDPEHIQWIYNHAKQRADEYNIRGVTYRLTQGIRTTKFYCQLHQRMFK